MSVDDNGEGEIMSLWIVSDESCETIREMMKVFKWGNDNWTSIRYRVIVILFVRVTWSYYYAEVLGISLLDIKN
jgi:hypothetical protein